MKKLSVVVSVYNGEDKIEPCLKSVKPFADEIIVVNNSSTDNTVAIAKKYTSKIFARPNNPMLNINKNYGISKASGNWVLYLDDDERVTQELAEKIREIINEEGDVNGYWIPRKNIIFGKWIKNSIWWPDYQMRLFKNGKGRYAEKHVHEYIDVDGKTEQLPEAMIHENYTSVSQYLQKLDRIYTENEAENIISSGRKLSWVDAIRFPLNDFLKTFFAQKGYKDGLHGLVLSILQAFYAEIVFAKVWERQGFTEENSPDFVKKVNKEFKRAGSEITYWFFTLSIDESQSKVKKVFYKLARKKSEKQAKKM